MAETRRPRGRIPTLSREAVLEAARQLPPEDVTLAAVSARLGVTSPALYRYFPDRAAILQALATQARQELEPPDPSLPWDTWLREAGRRERDLWRTHTALYETADYRAHAAPMVRIVVDGLRVLIAAGFAAAEALAGVTAVVELAHAFGHAEARRTADSEVSPELAQELQALMREAMPVDLERLLETCMDVTIAGLRVRLRPPD